MAAEEPLQSDWDFQSQAIAAGNEQLTEMCSKAAGLTCSLNCVKKSPHVRLFHDS